MLIIWLSLFSSCRLFRILLNRMRLVSCTSTWQQKTFFHVPVGASEKNHTTETTTHRVWSDILMAADEPLLTLLGQLDISAVFDCVDHPMLDHLWSDVVRCDSVLDWVRSFLADRTQQIAYNCHMLSFRDDSYWARVCIFSAQLSWPSSSPVMTSTCTSMPKISAPNQPSDFRPISITPILTRIMERTVVSEFIYPTLQAPPLSLSFADQFAFHPTGSSNAAIISFLNSVTKLLHNNPYVM